MRMINDEVEMMTTSMLVPVFVDHEPLCEPADDAAVVLARLPPGRIDQWPVAHHRIRRIADIARALPTEEEPRRQGSEVEDSIRTVAVFGLKLSVPKRPET